MSNLSPILFLACLLLLWLLSVFVVVFSFLFIDACVGVAVILRATEWAMASARSYVAGSASDSFSASASASASSVSSVE